MKAALSLDLDNKWSYMKTHGDARWSDLPSYLDIVVPRALQLLGDLDLKITFFIVGQDADLQCNAEALAQIPAQGHEIGNHSFFHEPWMHRRTQPEIAEECARAEESIERATGVRPRGFRAPGFAHSPALLRALASRGYAYDASSLPTFIGPFARAYYFRSAKLDKQAMRERADLFGNFSDGLRSNRPYTIPADHTSIREIPVTTMPLLRLPIHISYVLYIAALSPAFALAYFRAALSLCALTGTPPSILLHPLDFLTAAECPELRFFPGMDLNPGLKARVVREALLQLKRRYEVVPVQTLAAIWKDRGILQPS